MSGKKKHFKQHRDAQLKEWGEQIDFSSVIVKPVKSRERTSYRKLLGLDQVWAQAKVMYQSWS